MTGEAVTRYLNLDCIVSIHTIDSTDTKTCILRWTTRRVAPWRHWSTATASTPGGTPEATDAAGAKAAEKLEAAGFSLPLYRDALRAYARQADVPGLGPKAPAIADGTVNAPAQADIAGGLAATPKEQAGLDLLRKAAGQGGSANDGQGFWAAKYLLSTMAKG